MELEPTAFQDKRTNSLAFAQSDCHTCASTAERCDRRRPRCSTCLDHGRKCGGFATPLSWDPRRMWIDDPSTMRDGSTAVLNRDASSRPEQGPDRPAPPRRFRFIKGASKPRKQRKASRRNHASRIESGQNEDIELVPRMVENVDPNDKLMENVSSGLEGKMRSWIEAVLYSPDHDFRNP